MVDYKVVADFSFEDEDISPPNSIEKTKRSANRIWRKLRVFDSAQEAENAPELQNYSISSRKETVPGVKIEYRCVKGQYRKAECPSQMYLLYHSESLKVSLFATNCSHQHITIQAGGLNDSTKDLIVQMFEDGITKPNLIIQAFRQRNLPEPEKNQIKSFLASLRLTKFGPSAISGTDIKSWCEERRQIPEDMDEPFVLNHTISCDSFDIDDQDIKIFASTPRLMGQLKLSNMIQIDATYILIWQGYPVMVFGTSDKKKQFHPFGIAVCKSETTSDFSFVFRTIQEFNPEWKPSVLLADGSDSITKVFENVYGKPQVRSMCYFHVIKNLDTHLRHLPNKKEIKDDIHILQLSKSVEEFQVGCDLFFKKWRDAKDVKTEEFLDYFKCSWINHYPSWYEGAAPGYPSTNNGIESTNAVIKKEHTLRERLPVGQFLNNMGTLLAKWSKDRHPEGPNAKLFAVHAEPNLKDWTLAYQWAMENKKVLSETTGEGEIFYVCSTSNAGDVSEELVQEWKEQQLKWTSLDAFKKHASSLWAIVVDRSNVLNGSCSCPVYLKNNVCKHFLGMKLRLKLEVAPPAAKAIPLGQKRKRGRPSMAKKALIIQ